MANPACANQSCWNAIKNDKLYHINFVCIYNDREFKKK